MNMNTLPDIVGMIGVCSILASYWLLQRGTFKPDLLYYYVMNGGGAALVVFSLFFDWNTSAMVIEVAFVLISIWAIFKILRQRAKDGITQSKSATKM